MARLQMYLFGTPRLESQSQLIPINRRKVAALAAYLAVNVQPHSRDMLATLFWPEYDQSSARANLRRELSRLKNTVGDEVLHIDRSQVSMHPAADYWVDVVHFQAQVNQLREHDHFPKRACTTCLTACETAVSLYTADFMAGFSLPDSPAYDEWQFFQVESLRRSLAEILQKLITWHRSQSEFERCIEYGRRWLALDTLHEPAHRQLMQLYAWTGQQAAALRQYEECVRILDEEMGVSPEPETTELYEAIHQRRLLLPEFQAAEGGASESPASLPPVERYERGELLATGGHGEVYLGRDVVTDKPVVIKRLRPELTTQDDEYLIRFQREGEILRQLNHPNIVQMLAMFEREGQQHIVMEYVPGGSLRQLLDKTGPLPLKQALAIALELADALSRAHHLGVIHRDLKPANILLAEDGTPRLTDFGVARLERSESGITGTGALLGSPGYMSPEALLSQKTDTRSDIWSLGAVLYEMVIGNSPFGETAMAKMVIRVLHDPVPDLRVLREDVPPALNNLVQHMLHKEPDERIGSVRQVAAALEAIQNGRSPHPPLSLNLTPETLPPEMVTAVPISDPAAAMFHHLPTPATPFVGREKELAQIQQNLVEDHACRLLSLIGPGGIGKSRLSIEAGQRLAAHYPDGVYFVPLAMVAEADYIVPAIAQALDLQFSGAATPRTQLLNYLRPRKLLLILDNLEHLLTGVDLLSDLLQAAPTLNILATSRVRLMLAEEWGYELHGLSFPTTTNPLSTRADWESFSALRLFVQQARRAHAAFTVTEGDLPHLEKLCRLLDGLPLALELAASWVRAISVAEIVAEIEQDLDFLSADAATAPIEERHRSLRAIFNQMWRSLSEDEKRVLQRLSVFRGGCTRAAAVAVTGAALPDLARLLDHSLLRREENGRYTLHELIRQFAVTQLERDAVEAETIRDQHSDFYLDFLAERAPAIKGGRQQTVLTEIASDIDNIRAAWQHGVRRRRLSALSEAAECFWLYCEFRGDLSGGEDLFNQTREALTTSAPVDREETLLLAFLRAGQGSLAARRGWLAEGIVHMRAGITALRQIEPPDHQKEAFAVAWLAFGLMMQGKYEESACAAQESLDLYPETRDDWLKAGCLRLLGASALHRGRLDEAADYLTACLETCAQIDERRIRTYASMNQGRIALLRGEYGQAQQWLDESLNLSQQLDDKLSHADLLRDLGLLAVHQGQIDQALVHLEKSLAIAEEIGSSNTGATKTYLGIVWQQRGEWDKATHLLRDGLAAARTLGHQAEVAECLHQMGILTYRQGAEHQAEQFLHEALVVWQELDNEPMLAAVYNSLGRVMTRAGESRTGEACRFYRLALQVACSHKLAPVALDVFTGVAPLLLHAGKVQRAVALLSLAEKHPASSGATREAARLALEELPAHEVAAEHSREQLPDWREMAAGLVEELETAVSTQKSTKIKLPQPSTPFVGRKQELAAVRKLLLDDAANRLVTLSGPGGMGKTRLALAVAASLVDHFPDGVIFLELAPLDSPAQILPELAEQLDFHFQGQATPETQLIDFLRDKQLLLILDNFEHLLSEATLAGRILQGAPRVKILATSRERLNLIQETLFPLPGMALPQESQAQTLLENEAALLFIQQAGLSAAELEQSPESMQAIARLCHLVDGMPLALVLAAGWLDVLTLPEIADEIATCFDVLEGDMRDLPERQRSVRAVFTTSWNQLTAADKQILAKLSLFRNGFTRPAANQVAGATVRILLTLVNRSWLQRDANGRFHMHELARQFAREKLRSSPEAQAEAREQYVRYFIDLFHETNQMMNGPQQKEAIRIVATEFDNVRVAWERLIAEGRVVEVVDELLPAIFRFCEAQLKALEMNALLRPAQKGVAAAVLDEAEKRRLQVILLTAQSAFCLNGYPIRFETFGLLIPAELKSIREAWALTGSLERLQELHVWGILLTYIYGRIINREEGQVIMRQLVTYHRTAKAQRPLALALLFLVNLMQLDYTDKEKQQEIETHIQEALAIYKAYGDEREGGLTLRALGQLRRFQHDFEAAIDLWQTAQAQLQTAGDVVIAADLHWQIGDVYMQLGRFEEAFSSYRKTSDAYLEMGITRLAAQVLSKESYEAVRYSTLEHALETRERSLAISQEWGDTWAVAWCLWEMGEIYRVLGDLAAARSWYDKARTVFDEVGDRSGYIFYHRGLGDIARCRVILRKRKPSSPRASNMPRNQTMIGALPMPAPVWPGRQLRLKHMTKPVNI
ncbi:MAG: protein kinase [Anaerolineae bacterium]|nr:protein kinase [Anaerolineae bacterium]